MIQETLFSRNSDEWETPDAFFQDIDKEFQFDLDACASEENHKCEKYFTIEDDGLTKNWGGPYSLVQSTIQRCHKLDKEVLLRRA